MTRNTHGTPRPAGLAMGGLLLAACGDKGLPYNMPGFDFGPRYKTVPQGAPVLLDNTSGGSA